MYLLSVWTRHRRVSNRARRVRGCLDGYLCYNIKKQLRPRDKYRLYIRSTRRVNAPSRSLNRTRLGARFPTDLCSPDTASSAHAHFYSMLQIPVVHHRIIGTSYGEIGQLYNPDEN